MFLVSLICIPLKDERNYIGWFDNNAFLTPSTHNGYNNGINPNLTIIVGATESPSTINYRGIYAHSLVLAFAVGSLLSSKSIHIINKNINLTTISKNQSLSVGRHLTSINSFDQC